MRALNQDEIKESLEFAGEIKKLCALKKAPVRKIMALLGKDGSVLYRLEKGLQRAPKDWRERLDDLTKLIDLDVLYAKERSNGEFVFIVAKLGQLEAVYPTSKDYMAALKKWESQKS